MPINGVSNSGNLAGLSNPAGGARSVRMALSDLAGGRSGVVIADSPSNVLAALGDLQAYSDRVGSLTLTGAVPNLDISLRQLNANTDILSKLTTGAKVTVTGVLAAAANTVASNPKVTNLVVLDTAENISKNLGQLQNASNKLNSITQIGQPQPLILSASNVQANVSALNKISGFGVRVADTGANISSNIAALNALGKRLDVIGFTDKNTSISLSSRALLSDPTFARKLPQTANLTVTAPIADIAKTVADPRVKSINVVDSFYNITTNLNTLAKYRNKVSMVTQQETTRNTSTASEAASYASTYFSAQQKGKLPSLNISIADSASNIKTNIRNLIPLGSSLRSITQTDSTQSIIDLAASNASDCADVLKTIVGFTTSITDTTTAIGTKLDTLQALGSTLSSITLSDPDTTLTLSARQVVQDAATIKKIIPAKAIAITDTATNIASNLDKLRLSGITIESVTVSDPSTPMTITAQQLEDNADTIGLIDAPLFNLREVSYADLSTYQNDARVQTIDTVINISLAQASGLILDDPHNKFDADSTTYQITDTPSTILSNLDTVRTHIGNIAKIDVTPAGSTFDFSASTALQYPDVLAKIPTAQQRIVDTVANLTNNQTALLNLVNKPALIASDTATNLQSNLRQLQPLNERITRLEQTTQPATNMVFSFASINGNESLLSKINGFTVSIKDTTANLNNNLDRLTSIASVLDDKLTLILPTNQVTVPPITAARYVATSKAEQRLAMPIANIVDSGANISRYLDQLQSAQTKIGSITLMGNANVLSLTPQQLRDNTGVLSKISGTFKLVIQDALISDLPTLTANSQVSGISVRDTASNVAASLQALNVLGNTLTAIRPMDSDTVLNLSASQVTQFSRTIDLASRIDASGIDGFQVSVKDSAAAMTQNLAGLRNLGARLVSFEAIGGNTAPTKIKADDALLFTRSIGLAVAVEDTADSISKNFDALSRLGQTLGPRVTSIIQTQPADLVLNARQLQMDFNAALIDPTTGILSKLIVNSAIVTDPITKVTTQYTTPYRIALQDTSANISRYVDVLPEVNAHLASIKQLGFASPLNISREQAKAAEPALSKIISAYSVQSPYIPATY